MKAALNVQAFSENELVERLERGAPVFSHCITIRNPDGTMPKRSACQVRLFLPYPLSTSSRLPTLAPF